MERPVRITRIAKREFYETVFELHERMTAVPAQIPLSRLSKLVSGRRLAGESAPAPDCITCGACCVFGLVIPVNRRDPEPLESYLEITLDDADDVVIERVIERDKRDGRCSNLVGEIGREIGCRAYEQRPQICREFEAGSDRCFGYRRMCGIDPPLTEAELADAERKLGDVSEQIRIRGIEIKMEATNVVFDRTAVDPANQLVHVRTLKITAHMSDGQVIDIHTYEAAKESWYEHELEGLTLVEAKAVIEQRRVGS